MSKLKIFVFNSFSVNTIVIYDETKECIIIDAGCSNSSEEQILKDFISENNLKPTHLLNTHYHIDHIIGNKFITETYHLKPEAHREGKVFWGNGRMWGAIFGIKENDLIKAESFLQEGDVVKFGNTELQVIETPGHAAGSICFYNKTENYIIVGDLIFLQSVGRTDLPTGNFDLLQEQISQKIFTLPDSTKIIPGHGPFTDVGFEKKNNPFF